MFFEIVPTLFLFCLNSKYVVNKALKPFFPAHGVLYFLAN